MFRKKIIYLLCIFLLYSCGYTAVYNDTTNKNFDIKITSLKGDDLINKLIKTNLKRHMSSNSEKKYSIKIDTSYDMKDISKDVTGKISNYQVNIISIVNISSDIVNERIIIKENFKINNTQNSFEKKSYENSIKKTYAQNTSDKIIMRLLKM